MGRTMSKRQEKIEQRRQEQHEFLSARRSQQLAMLEHMFEVGNKLYEDNKEKLSEEEIAQIEKMRTEQLETLANVRRELEGYIGKKDLDSGTQA